MVRTEIERPATDQEKRDFSDIGKFRSETAEDKFLVEISKKEREANKKGLPFARHAAQAEFQDFQESKKRELKRQGYISSESLKEFKINWSKFSDLKKFEETRDDEVEDKQLQKNNPGLHVTKKLKEYQYIGFQNVYRVMETSAEAIKRAKEAAAPQPVVVKQEKK